MSDGTEIGTQESIRLSEITLNYNFSEYNERLKILDKFMQESKFHLKMILKGWGAFEFSIFGVGVLAILLGSWDLGIGELRSGGDYNRVGSEGMLFLEDLSLMLSLLSMIAWGIFVIQLFIRFPIMRENLVWMIVGMIAVQIGYIITYSDYPNFPENVNIGMLAPIILANLIFSFLVIFVVHRAVIETRDVHVIERHSHPDPRVVATAWKDHSLRLWSLGLGTWMVLVNIFSWSSSKSVALRPISSEETVFNYPWLYLVCSIISIFFLIHIIWYPQFMLGAAEDRIQSVRAREVSGEIDYKSTKDVQGICPICKEETAAIQKANGKITIPCEYNCGGVGTPGSICKECEMTLPTRINCANCNSNTIISSHFSRQDAW
ncbi:MAG: hypothetical protein CMB15_04895 [Euryarchaeota archaeon]|nr:hypothetical protein [Euryarchaeota archaeon]|tara:strand:- start:7142 stop:8272 length:1131 start_codon:yes stop_codon:yes gene_type:complete